jgi:alpha-1,2-mannosyltransferase
VNPSTDPAGPARARTDRWFWIAAGVLATAGGIALMIGAARHGMIDLRVYRMGGSVLLDGDSLYDAHLPDTGLPFTYPPFAAIAMIPLALLPWWLAALVWTGISVLCLAAIWRVALRREWPGLQKLSRRRAAWVLAGITLLSVALEPVRETLLFGQINLVLTAMILIDLAGPSRRWRGALVGVAAALKLTPVLFLALLVVTRQWRLLRNAVLGFVAAVAIGFAVVPNQSWDYWTRVVRDANRIGGLAFTSNQSVMGFLTRLLGDASPALQPTWFVIATLIALFALWVARRYWYAGDRVAAVSVCALGALFASPVSWSHHWVWALPIGVALVAVVFRRTGSNRAAAVTGVLWFGLLALGPMWWVPNREDRELHWSVWESLPGNAYLIAGLAAFVVFAWASAPVRRTGNPTSEPQPANSSSSPPTV